MEQEERIKSEELFIYGFTVITALIQTLFLDIPFEPESDFNPFELVSLAIYYILICHAIYISYNAALTFTNIHVDRAKLWFVILPSVIYMILLLALVITLNSLL